MSLKKLVIIFTLISMVTLVTIATYITSTLNTINLELVFAPKAANENKDISSLEEGSIVRKEELKTFFNFSNQLISFEDWLKEKFQRGEVEAIKNKNQLLVKADISLPAIRKNHCENAYCYQSRMEFKEIPSVFWRGLIGIEDSRFLDHKGVDYKSILRALIADIKAMSLVQGGSTLTQQLVKNLFLTNEKSLKRKFRELIYSIYIEKKYEKTDILSAYLNEVYWGGVQGIKIKGVFAASIFYFNKGPNELTEFEVAILISLLKGPNYYRPTKYLSRLRSRVKATFARLKKIKIFPSSAKKWDQKKWESFQLMIKKRAKERFHRSLVLSKVYPPGNFNSYERFIFANSVQKVVSEIKQIRPDRKFSVKAFIGSPFCDENCKNFKYYSKSERSLGRGLSSEYHQVGSVFKPISYNLILKNGKSWDDLVSTEPIKFQLKSGQWSPKDTPSKKSDQPMITIREALKNSKNRPLLRLSRELGMDTVEKELGRFIPRLKTPLREYPAQLIGSIELSIEEVFYVYKKFILEECHAVANNSEGDSMKTDGEIENSILWVLSNPAQGTVRRFANNIFKNLRVFGKTGTTNGSRDNWYIFFDGENLGVIWFGVEQKKDNKDIRLSGASTSFRIFQDFFTYRGRRFADLNCPLMK